MEKGEYRLRKEDVEDLAVGAAILGTGGGGDPYIGKLMVTQVLEKGKEIVLVPPESVPDEAFIITSAFMGTPVTLIEKLPSGLEALRALEALESYFGRRADYITPVEAGGLNSTIPLYVGGLSGRPVLDGDGMGRAFPELQMVTFHLYGIKATPMSLADEKGNSVILDTIDNFWAEKIARVVTIRMGGWASIAIYSMEGRQYKRAVIPRTITKAIEIGRAVRDAKKHGRNPLDAVLDVTRGFKLFEGKMVDVSRWIVAGFAKGEVKIEGLNEYRGKTMKISFQNENLVAEVDGEVVASVPDLIVVLDLETGEPITTERHRYGYRVSVIGIPCDAKWRTPEALKIVGPRYFGYDIEYVPIEERVKKAGVGG
ncbi:MAG: DUF917 domain-containing protein [Desulfurococcales archaeon]|nr:DUF917 domain-containing protein [Desulfurococcales archaeon]